MKLVQLHYFLSQNVRGDKIYYVPPCPKVEGDMSPHTLGPWYMVRERLGTHGLAYLCAT